MLKRIAALLVCVTMMVAANVEPSVAYWSATANTVATTSQAQTLAPPTGLSVSVDCVLLTLLVPRVTLTWTPSPTPFTDSYDILRSLTSGGPYTQIGTAPGGSTGTFSHTNLLSVGETYYYVIRARRTNWISTQTTQVTANLPLLLCL